MESLQINTSKLLQTRCHGPDGRGYFWELYSRCAKKATVPIKEKLYLQASFFAIYLFSFDLSLLQYRIKQRNFGRPYVTRYLRVSRAEVGNLTLAELWLDSLVAVCAWLTARLPSGLMAMLLNLRQVVRPAGQTDGTGRQQKRIVSCFKNIYILR